MGVAPSNGSRRRAELVAAQMASALHEFLRWRYSKILWRGILER